MKKDITTHGRGRLYLRGDTIWVNATVEGIRVRKSTGKKLNKTTEYWFKKADPIEVAKNLLKEELKEKQHQNVDIQTYGLRVLQLTIDASESGRGLETHNDYTRILMKIIVPYFEKYLLVDIGASDIVAFLIEMKKKYSGDRASRIRYVLTLILDSAYDDGLIQINPMYTRSVKRIKFSRNVKNTKAYTTDETRRILEASEGWLKIFLDLSFKYGLRTGECMGLKWADFNFQEGKLHLQRSITHGIIKEAINELDGNKKNHNRMILLFDSTLDLLKEYYEERLHDEWLFVDENKKYFRESQRISDGYFKPFLASIDIEYKTLYATRRSYASIMKFGGKNMNEIQATIGHSQNSKVTDKHYVKRDVLNLSQERVLANESEMIFQVMIQSDENT